jgi:hypothetical protein
VNFNPTKRPKSDIIIVQKSMYKRTKNCVCELMFLDSSLGLKISVVLIVKSMQSERCIYETTTQMRSFLILCLV